MLKGTDLEGIRTNVWVSEEGGGFARGPKASRRESRFDSLFLPLLHTDPISSLSALAGLTLAEGPPIPDTILTQSADD
jgi:hypothetical protein